MNDKDQDRAGRRAHARTSSSNSWPEVVQFTAKLDNAGRVAFDELVAGNLDADLLVVHLMQVELGMTGTPDPPAWIDSLPRAQKAVKELKNLADVIETIDKQGFLNPTTFIRYRDSGDKDRLDVRLPATRELQHLPREMRTRADFLEHQVKTIRRWRRVWLRGNFALTESIKLIADYVGSESSLSRRRWKLLADLLNNLAKGKNVGIFYTSDSLRVAFKRAR